MSNTEAERIFFKHNIRMKKKYTNMELKLHQFFHEQTGIYPENIILLNNFIFFIVDGSMYFKAKLYIKSLRKKLNKKVMVIRNENTLINLIFSLFPDIYVHDLKLEVDEETGLKAISVCFVSFEERGIAVGSNGDYIKTVNLMFDKYVNFEKDSFPIKISCETIDL